MLFNSYIFVLLFLPVSLIGYFILNHFNLYVIAKVFLFSMSIWFYAYFNVSYLTIIIISIVFNYGIGNVLLTNKIRKIWHRKFLLLFGLSCNIGVLIYFKYFDFLIENVNALFSTDFNLLHLMLPLGISFFTFQQVAYIVDSYRKEAYQSGFLDYSLSVVFFPKLLSGPIVMHNEIVTQFTDIDKKHINYENFAKGIMAFALGMAKKVLVADTFGKVVTWGYSSIEMLDSTNALLIMLAYTIHIYFDFSGYSDMAMGVGLMFNIDMINNFDSPYQAFTIAEFWKRWHISLTRFFTRYIYIPLGGNRKGKVRTYINTLIIFIISGLWHGANWTFIFWGLLHGIAVVLNRIFQNKIKNVHPALLWLETFCFINVTWIYFRAPSIAEGTQLIKMILYSDFGAINPEIISCFAIPELEEILSLLKLTVSPWTVIVCFGCAIIAFLSMKNTKERIDNFRPSFVQMIIVPVLLLWSVISFSGVSSFLYINF